MDGCMLLALFPVYCNMPYFTTLYSGGGWTRGQKREGARAGGALPGETPARSPGSTPVQGYLAHKKHPDPTVARCLGTYGNPTGVGVADERVTLVGHPTAKVLPGETPARSPGSTPATQERDEYLLNL